MKKIAVTAASGKLGSEIAKATVEIVGKENVVGLARTPSKAESLGIEIRPGDYNSRSDLERSLQGVDSVLLISGMDAPDKRITQHRNVIEAAKSAGVSRIVYTIIQGAQESTAFCNRPAAPLSRRREFVAATTRARTYGIIGAVVMATDCRLRSLPA
ncbi:NAD(P)H-binding protein [Stieleria sp. ICT_E10.1]|uniref:NAD(P)H-binding protein n=1 Tax=Stieleria sedimenti TaxID=2976331 RepID=UPI0021800643|nr:NAD(P)H-binding protein [Stieleria sedimenti]MCS7471275.1 NAD(P)H-binding protein [Stieleria sedimenti]